MKNIEIKTGTKKNVIIQFLMTNNFGMKKKKYCNKKKKQMHAHFFMKYKIAKKFFFG